MSHEQPIQAEGMNSRPPLYQNQMSSKQFNMKSHQVSMDQVQNKENSNLAMLQQPHGKADNGSMIPRQIIGLPAEAGGTFTDLPKQYHNGQNISHNNSQSQPEIQNQIYAQNQLLYVNKNPSQDNGTIQQKIHANKKMNMMRNQLDDSRQ